MSEKPKEEYQCNNCGQCLEPIEEGVLMCTNCGFVISKGEKRLGVELDAIAKAAKAKRLKEIIQEFLN